MQHPVAMAGSPLIRVPPAILQQPGSLLDVLQRVLPWMEPHVPHPLGIVIYIVYYEVLHRVPDLERAVVQFGTRLEVEVRQRVLLEAFTWAAERSPVLAAALGRVEDRTGPWLHALLRAASRYRIGPADGAWECPLLTLVASAPLPPTRTGQEDALLTVHVPVYGLPARAGAPALAAPPPDPAVATAPGADCLPPTGRADQDGRRTPRRRSRSGRAGW